MRLYVAARRRSATRSVGPAVVTAPPCCGIGPAGLRPRYRPITAPPCSPPERTPVRPGRARAWRSEEHTSELQSLMRISYAVFCLKKKKNKPKHEEHTPITTST